MYDEQKIILSYKIYLENIRNRIFNDNKGGLTDGAKLFEGVVASLYNIYYETDDFETFTSPNQPTIDLKSDKKKVAVSVKSKENHESKTSITQTVRDFKKNYPALKS